MKGERGGPLLDAPAAIDVDHLAGHVIAVIRRKEGRGADDVFGIRHAFDLQRIAHDIVVGLAFFFLEADINKVFVQLLPKRCHDNAGRVAIHSDIVLC